MNKTIANLALIADAAEYFDRQTGAAWKIRAAMTNAVVWAANAYLYALEGSDRQRLCLTMTKVATLRTWARDMNDSSLALDLMPGNVARTLGLERVRDVHADACKVARTKCMQTRSAVNFKRFYDEAIANITEQEARRRANVEGISQLLADDYFAFAGEFMAPNGVNFMVKDALKDEDLYDEATVEDTADRIDEVVANALESMYAECEAQLAGAIVSHKIVRLEGYLNAIQQMMRVVGVDLTRVAKRQAALEAQINEQIANVGKTADAIKADIEAQIAAMVAEPVQAEPEPAKPTRRRVPKEEAAS